MFHNLLAEMARIGISQGDICRCINKCHSNVSEKINGKREFKLSEMKKIKEEFFPDLSLDYLFETK